MKKAMLFCLAVCLLFAACSTPEQQETNPVGSMPQEEWVTKPVDENAVKIQLSDEGITVNGTGISENTADAVYAANDIVYYEAGKDFTYGEGTKDDEHSAEEADVHTVVHITKPGQYVLSGKLSAGQIAVDLGEGAEEDPNAVVSLVLDGADITCTVAPAVIFYRVYECGVADEDTATMDVDTSNAGANVILASGSENNIRGSYVARIYKSVELNEDKTQVVDSKKLHKYDGAFYSKMSMNIYAEDGDVPGKLNIYAENEGLDTELHLTIYSGDIHIESGNDGINTNEDNVSVTHILGGKLDIVVNGSTGEGDGIDSNGWLLIDGGTVTSSACGFSGDAGIDADKGVYLRGGTVAASGNMLDHVQGDATYGVFTFAQRQSGGKTYTLKNEAGAEVLTCTPANDFQYLIILTPVLIPGEYTLWQGETQLSAGAGGQMGGPNMPGGAGPSKPEDMEPPMGEQPSFPVGERPSMPEGEGPSMPEGEIPSMPADEPGQRPGGMGGFFGQTGVESLVLNFQAGANYFHIT